MLILAVAPSITARPAADGRTSGGISVGANLAGAAGQGAISGKAKPANTAGPGKARAASTKAGSGQASAKPSANSTGSGQKHSGSSVPTGTPQQIALAMLADYGWTQSQFGCLVSLWNMESGWNPYATNPSSGAYGIPQSLPAYKMASAGADWRTNPVTQIRWGLTYIQGRYGTPCGAWAHETAYYWY